MARHHGRLVAYENLCKHLPLTLDYADNRFFTADGAHLMCRSHGAIYDPANGRCVDGPCNGASLTPIEIEIQDGYVWLTEETDQA